MSGIYKQPIYLKKEFSSIKKHGLPACLIEVSNP